MTMKYCPECKEVMDTKVLPNDGAFSGSKNWLDSLELIKNKEVKEKCYTIFVRNLKCLNCGTLWDTYEIPYNQFLELKLHIENLQKEIEERDTQIENVQNQLIDVIGHLGLKVGKIGD